MKPLFKCLSRGAVCCVLTAVFPVQAYATAGMYCAGIGSDVEVDILFGGAPVLSIIDVSLSTEDVYFSTQNRQDATPAHIARAFADAGSVRIDLIDDQASELLASIRVLRSGGEEPLQIGYLQIREDQPLGITCDGP